MVMEALMVAELEGGCVQLSALSLSLSLSAFYLSLPLALALALSLVSALLKLAAVPARRASLLLFLRVLWTHHDCCDSPKCDPCA
mmetsp:Transcript_26858/g.54725  ORF Transcript_26858/g.54725 Transcript_26858/m.54725 type:complete len:85 (+) Transcript_26858:100-354(+)